jgi:hypothetical protein
MTDHPGAAQPPEPDPLPPPDVGSGAAPPPATTPPADSHAGAADPGAQAPTPPPSTGPGAATPTTAAGAVTEADRVAALDEAVAKNVRAGWRVESRGQYQAVVVKGSKPNHILHLILSIVTLGLWIPVWILITIFSSVKRDTLTVDATGVVRNGRGDTSSA